MTDVEHYVSVQNELFITTAWYDLSDAQGKAQPLAGDLFRIRTDITGIAEPVFDG